MYKYKTTFSQDKLYLHIIKDGRFNITENVSFVDSYCVGSCFNA